MKALVLTLGVLLVGISSAFGQDESVADAARRLRASKNAPVAAPTAPASTVAPDVAGATSPAPASTVAQGPTMWRTHRIGETFEDFAAETRFNYDTAKASCGQARGNALLKHGACALVRLHDKTIDTSMLKYCPTCADSESFTVPMGSDNAVSVTITFWKRTLADVSILVVRVQDMDEQLNLLIAKYGKPSSENKLKTTNKFGSSWEDTAWFWSMTDGAEITALTNNEPSKSGLPSFLVSIKSAAMVAEKKRQSEATKVNPY
jgi:hypothetical protein